MNREVSEKGIYERYIKRLLDFILSLLALVILSPFLLIFTVLGTVKMKGNPFFTQERPGRDEKIFKLIKLRTMTNEKGSDGNFLPDEQRLTKYGRFLRSTSIDELPELINILKGDMSIAGPRPQLVRDMVFMSDEQRRRHKVRPGLTGLAQVKGRNSIDWDERLKFDIIYIDDISLKRDIKIVLLTAIGVVKREGITEDGSSTSTDYGDYLLQRGRISREFYESKQVEAQKIIDDLRR